MGGTDIDIEYDYEHGIGQEDGEFAQQMNRKPEAKFVPCLFVQEGMGSDGRTMRCSGGPGRSADKSRAAIEIEQLAEAIGVPIARLDKGELNALSGNRPHRGYVLRCGAVSFEPITQLPHPDDANEDGSSSSSLWLVLDEGLSIRRTLVPWFDRLTSSVEAVKALAFWYVPRTLPQHLQSLAQQPVQACWSYVTYVVKTF